MAKISIKRGPPTPAPAIYPVLNLQGQMGRVLEEFLSEFPWATTPSRHPSGELFRRLETPFGPFGPHVDISETPQAYEIAIEIPGLAEEDLEVSVSGDVLSIGGHKKAEETEKAREYLRAERKYGSFCRQFRLSSEVDQDGIEATIKNGLLTVTVPKRTRAEP